MRPIPRIRRCATGWTGPASAPSGLAVQASECPKGENRSTLPLPRH
jgi:hypothetical protein